GGVNLAFGEDTYFGLGHADGEIGFWIGSAFWNKGYATEAVNALLERVFTKLRLENVWAGCLVENKRCIRVQDKCGFAFDRVNKNLYWKATDQFISIRIAKLSRERWEFLRRKNGELAR
ncbi:MAG: GNAT family N-acetyltransferase, partial [Bacilli bacterium]|nr:GNAT family N-acetyltransferase [Bacilli bacterium]